VNRIQQGSEEGFTLIELSVAMLLTAILLTIVALVMNTLVHVETDTSSSYKEMNQLIPVGTSFQRLLRTAVRPATGGAGNAPVPPFGLYKTTGSLTPSAPISSTSLTFFSNTGTPNGPVKVTATLANRTFTVTTAAPKATSCPGLGTRPFTDRCTWTAATPRTLFKVTDVDNMTLGKPVFSYHLLPPMNGPVGTNSYGTPATLGSHPFTECKPPTYVTTPTTPAHLIKKPVTHCPAAAVESVKVDLEVSVGRSAKVESQTVTYQLSTVSQTYSPEVG